MLLRLSQVLVPAFASSCHAYLHDTSSRPERVAGVGDESADDAALLVGVPVTDGSVLVVRLAGRTRPLGALVLRRQASRPFSEDDERFAHRIARLASLEIENTLLLDAAEGAHAESRRARAESGEEARRLEVLADAGRLLTGPLDDPGMLLTFAKSLVPGLADWCIIYTLTGDRLTPIATHHRDPLLSSELAELAKLDAKAPGPLGATRVRTSGRAQLLFQVPDRILPGLAPDEVRRKLLSSVGITSQMALPLVARGRTLGVLVVTYAGFRRYSTGDVALVEELARRMALALDNTRLYHDVHESEERYRLLVEGVQDHAIFMLDPDGRIATWNPGAERLFGYAANEVVGAPFAALSLDDGQAGDPVLEAARRDGRHEDDGWCLRNGGRFWGNRLVTRLASSDGEHRGFAVIVRDLSERAKARAALEQARSQLAATEKLSALGSLVSGVAHEIRTPLTAMSNNLHIMEMRLRPAMIERPDDALLQSLLTRVEEGIAGVDRLNRLVEDLRRFTHVRPGTRMRTSLDTVVREAADLFRAAHRGSIHVEASLDPTPLAEVDITQVQQVVLNLLQNAADATPHGGRIRLATSKHERGACIIVEDQGVGMPPDVYARMFEEFFTTKPEGTGLGLSIVRRIVESHKGSIDCESLPAKGTRFTVVLPSVA